MDPTQEAIATDQVAAHAGEASAHDHGPFHTHCENCATPLEGPYCHKCGQHDFEFHRSFGHVIHDALENFFHFDAKLFRNMVSLLFLPGRLTAEFNAGKRVAQVPPFRLYVFVAFIFFAIIFWGADKGGAMMFGPPMRVQNEGDGKSPPTVSVGTPNADMLANRVIRNAEARRQQRLATNEQSPVEAWIEEKARHAFEPEAQRELGHAFIAAMPKVLFFCLPFFALYTRFLFRKSGTVYLQHLVIALHFHTFIFLWVLWRNGWSDLIGLAASGPQRWFNLACNLWMIAYPAIMLRTLFRNSWTRTIVKTFLLALGYFLTMAFVFGTAAVLLVIFV